MDDLLLLRKTVHGNRNNLIAGAPSFNPLTFDVANLLALWDGDNAGVSQWDDEVAGHSLVYGSTGGGTSVVFVHAGLNGHQYLQFQQASANLYGSYAKGATPVRSQPTTQYLVLGTNQHAGNKYMLDDGVTSLRNAIQCVSPSPNIRYTSVTNGVNPISGSPAVGTFFVLTIVKQSGSNASLVQVNTEAIQNYTQTSLQDDSGYTLNKDTNLVAFTSVESKFAYIITRSGVDDASTRLKFQNYLISRFGL